MQVKGRLLKQAICVALAAYRVHWDQQDWGDDETPAGVRAKAKMTAAMDRYKASHRDLWEMEQVLIKLDPLYARTMPNKEEVEGRVPPLSEYA